MLLAEHGLDENGVSGSADPQTRHADVARQFYQGNDSLQTQRV
jgi:hypothetical protein